MTLEWLIPIRTFLQVLWLGVIFLFISTFAYTKDLGWAGVLIICLALAVLAANIAVAWDWVNELIAREGE